MGFRTVLISSLVLLLGIIVKHVGSECVTVMENAGFCDGEDIDLLCDEHKMLVIEKVEYWYWPQASAGACPVFGEDNSDSACLVEKTQGLTCDSGNSRSCQASFSPVSSSDCNQPSNYANVIYACQPEHDDPASTATARALNNGSAEWHGTMVHIDSLADWWQTKINSSSKCCRVDIAADTWWWVKMLYFFKFPDNGDCQQYVKVVAADGRDILGKDDLPIQPANPGEIKLCERQAGNNGNSVNGDLSDRHNAACLDTRRTFYVEYVTEDEDVDVMFTMQIATASGSQGLWLECNLECADLLINSTATPGTDDGFDWLPVIISMILLALLIFLIILCIVCCAGCADRRREDNEEERRAGFDNYTYVGKEIFLDGEHGSHLVMEKSLTPMSTLTYCDYCAK